MNISFITLFCCLLANLSCSQTHSHVEEPEPIRGFSHFDTTLPDDVSVVSSNGGSISNGRFVIPSGNLSVRVTEEKGAWLTVGDNSELIIDGNIQLEGNGFSGCDIIRVTGRNVRIQGKGNIVGDRWCHKGKEGEWGMGIRLHGATDVTVNGLTIADCWGDCIYIGGNSESIKISSCVLRGSRRQGISITKADGVTISNCHIANISGTMPQYAIDIEPNKRCAVDNVLIKDVTVTNCEGGFRAIIGRKGVGNARIGRVEINGCQVMAKSRHTLQFTGCENVIVKDCTIETRIGEKPILSKHVANLKEDNNKVIYK